MLPSFCDHVVKVTAPGKRLVHGDDVDDWSPGAVTVREIFGCWVEAKSSDENNHRRDTTRAGYDILIPGDAVPPTASDRVEHPLATGAYRVEGEPMQVHSADGSLDHWFIYVERWTNRG